MSGFGFVQLQRGREGIQYLVGHPGEVPALNAHVPAEVNTLEVPPLGDTNRRGSSLRLPPLQATGRGADKGQRLRLVPPTLTRQSAATSRALAHPRSSCASCHPDEHGSRWVDVLGPCQGRQLCAG